MPSIINRFGQQGVALIAAIIDLANIFDVVEWSGEQVGAANLVAVVIWSIIFGTAIRELNQAAS